jgi:hypothetical protein
MPRYTNHKEIDNSLSFYDKQFEARDVKKIIHYRPKPYLNFDREFILSLSFVEQVWQYNTKMYKLAFEFYSDQNLWWIIAAVNKKPTDAHWKPGEIVYIPTDPNKIIIKANSTDSTF